MLCNRPFPGPETLCQLQVDQGNDDQQDGKEHEGLLLALYRLQRGRQEGRGTRTALGQVRLPRNG